MGTELSAKMVLLESRLARMESQQRLHQSIPIPIPPAMTTALHTNSIGASHNVGTSRFYPHHPPSPLRPTSHQPIYHQMIEPSSARSYSLTPSFAPSETAHAELHHNQQQRRPQQHDGSFHEATNGDLHLAGLQVLDSSIAKLEMSLRSDHSGNVQRETVVHTPPRIQTSFRPPSSSSPKRPTSRMFP